MQDVSKNDGRTVLFVSHNMLAVKSLCNTGLLLSNGTVQTRDEIQRVIEKYISTNKASSFSVLEKESDGFVVHSVKASDNGVDGNFNIDKDLDITISVSCSQVKELINVNLFFNTYEGSLIFATCSPVEKFNKGKAVYTCTIPANTLNDNTYIIDLMVVYKREASLMYLNGVLTIEGHEEKRDGGWLGKYPGMIRPQYYNWNKTVING